MCFFKTRKASLTERDDDASALSLLVLFLIRLTEENRCSAATRSDSEVTSCQKNDEAADVSFGERKDERKTGGDGVANSECECEGGGIRRGDTLAQTLRRAKKRHTCRPAAAAGLILSCIKK